VVLAAVLVLTPQVLLYQGIVWKDVLFANVAIAGFVCLGFAALRWDRTKARVAPLAGALLFLAVAAWCGRTGCWSRPGGGGPRLDGAGRGWGRGIAWGVGGLAAMMLTSLAIGAAVEVRGSTQAATSTGPAVLQQYDIVGVVAHDPKARLDLIERASPAAAAAIAAGGQDYSPQRVDTLTDDPAFARRSPRCPTKRSPPSGGRSSCISRGLSAPALRRLPLAGRPAGHRPLPALHHRRGRPAGRDGRLEPAARLGAAGHGMSAYT